jgi:hypothetical protein
MIFPGKLDKYFNDLNFKDPRTACTVIVIIYFTWEVRGLQDINRDVRDKLTRK